MGSKSSMMLRDEEIKEIQAETGFSSGQIFCLYKRFMNLNDYNCQGSGILLTREKFNVIPELVVNPLGERIIDAFFKESKSDCVNFREFVRVLAHFRPIQPGCNNKLNSKEEKLRLIFNIYDLNNDGYISPEELQTILHMMTGESLSDKQKKNIVKRTFQEADKDNDQRISFEEFSCAITRDADKELSVNFLKQKSSSPSDDS
ncbi:hypothetical protein Pmani_007110 [Petrolisthes manimaculis]|uniref:EF-hand domain-containing protein n=1 Tax=Petrolisthes manimaculis TaxID=1843537 RepID=A0AAE1Q920_9EUCA|nr:hypothetical protein Pmani_007110 [Petrolisthes manimaculis]